MVTRKSFSVYLDLDRTLDCLKGLTLGDWDLDLGSSAQNTVAEDDIFNLQRPCPSPYFQESSYVSADLLLLSYKLSLLKLDFMEESRSRIMTTTDLHMYQDSLLE